VPEAAAPCEFADLDALRPQPDGHTHTLQGRGFPAAPGPHGDYVAVTSSAALTLGGEWLQTNVAEAHLQPLARGFSGAGLFLPHTGKVVGMLTDAVLGSARGGYTGRMLPLSTIRRYWPDLDDLIPATWLDSRKCRAELRAAVTGAGTFADDDVRNLLRATLPFLCRSTSQSSADPAWDIKTPWEAVRYVGESAVDEVSLRQFLRAMAPHLSDQARKRLAAWTHCWRAEWEAELDAGAELPVTTLVVEVRTPTRGGRTKAVVAVSPWVDGKPLPGRAEEHDVPRNEIEKTAGRLIAAQLSRLRPARLVIDFAVGLDDLSLPFDEWSYQLPGKFRSWPLRSNPVVVSYQGRLDPSNYTPGARDRWRVLRDAGQTPLHPVDCGLPYDGDAFYGWLDANKEIAALAYASRPRREWLEVALDLGVPVMLWLRGDCADEAVHAAHRKALDQLRVALGGADPAALPAEVAECRRRAWSPEADQRHCARHVTLYWDDPARLPDPPTGG
jgi:hypothetical protein